MRVPDLDTWSRILHGGVFGAAMAFVKGDFDVEGDLLAALRWWDEHHLPAFSDRIARAASVLRLERWLQSRERARRNIAFHYDRSNRFYQQFLDRRMVYSCAYFPDPSCSLECAQLAKLDHICMKLDLQPGDRFLDVGSGWGALVMRAAEQYGASALGCTLSEKQLAFAQEEISSRGLAARVRVERCDYRDVDGRFDKIASVGMYEHVGCARLRQYFDTLAARLEPHGLVLNHGIARPQDAGDDGTTVFVERHVFPGGELPYLSDVICNAERAGFEVLDVENLRPHYALTCAAWVARLQANRGPCLELVDEASYRIWLLYLAGSAVNFERGRTDVYQTLLARRSTRAPRRMARVA